MENQPLTQLGEESVSETPRPKANSTAFPEDLLSSHPSVRNLGASNHTKENDFNSINQFSPDYDERSSLSSFRSRSGTEFSKSSLGIVNVDQVSDYHTSILTDFDKDDESVTSSGQRSRKSDIEHYLRQSYERFSLGQVSSKSSSGKALSSSQKSVSMVSSKNSSNSIKSSVSDKNEKENSFRSLDSDNNKTDYALKSSLGNNHELESFSKGSISEKNKVENFLKDSSNIKMDLTSFHDKRPNGNRESDNCFMNFTKDSNEMDSIFNFKMDSASLHSLGFPDEEFQNFNNDVFMQELEKDEKLAKRDNNSITDHVIDGSLSGIMSGDMLVGPEDRLSMSDYLKNKCHSLSELDRSPLETVRELDEFLPYPEDTRRSMSDGILSDDSMYNWSRIQRGSLYKESFGVDLNATSASSTVSISEIAKIIREQSSATPRTIVDALFAGGENHRADRNCLSQLIGSSQSGTASNHSPPERDVEPSHPIRSSSSSSIQTDELCSSPEEARSKPNCASVDHITNARTSLNSCKSLPVSNSPLYCNGSQINSSSLLSSLKSARLSIDDKFLSAHSTPSDRRFVPSRKKFIPSLESNLDKNESQGWSSYNLSHKNTRTPADSSVKGSEFELALSALSTVSKFGSADDSSYVQFCRIQSDPSNLNDEAASVVSNSDNEHITSVPTPSSSSSSSSKRHYDSNHSRTITNSSKNESTLTPGKINANLSSSSRTSGTLTHQKQNEAALRKHKNDKTPISSSSSFAGPKSSTVYQSLDSIDMKLNNREYLPFESSHPHMNLHQQTSTNTTDLSSFADEQEFMNFKSNGVNESSCRFWLSDSENLDREEHDHSLSTVNYTINTMSDYNDNETSHLSSLSGSLLIEVLSNSSITCELDAEKSRIKLNLGDGDSVRADDFISAGIHCIGTPVDVIVPVLNKSKYDIMWQISYELSPVDGNQSAVNLAQVIVPQKTFAVPSNRKSNVHLIIIPLIATAIDVTLKIESLFKLKAGVRSVEKSSISQNIRLIGEDPQLSIVSSSGVIYFGKLPNGCVKSENIILQNTGHSRLPVKFSVEDSGKAEIYQGHTIIEAGETWSNDINLFAFIKSASETSDNSGADYIYGSLKIRLNVDPNIIRGPQSLCIIQLKAHVFPVNLLYSSLCSPLILSKPESSHICSEALDIRNGSKIPLNLSVSVKVDDDLKSCFDIRPSRISMAPDQLVRFVVSFNTKKCTSRKVNADIYLQVEPKGIIFKSPVEVLIAPILMSKAESIEKINLTDKCTITSSNSMSTSRSTSPTSSIASAVGQMQLACDVTCLVWSSVALHHREIQSCLVKNCGAHREKLLFQLTDNSNCFKIVKSEKDSSYVTDIKMSLNPSECKKLSVALFPSVPHTQAYGRITITRFGQDPNSSMDSNGVPVKRVLPLYGFCGSSNIRMNGLNKDVEDRLWLYPDSETFESTFTMENIGDSAAFMKIVPEQFSDDYVKPTEHILAPNESATVNYAVNLSAFRIEKLLEKQKNKDVVQVSRLVLYYGNESTRKRIKRILTKCKKKGVKLSPEIEQKLHLLSNILSKYDISVDKLFDPIENVSVLLDEIEVIQIGVLMERTALESALLDTSPVFNDLNTTVREVSTMSPASFVNVEPQALSIPVAGKTQVLNVTNSTNHDASFHAVFPPELSVNPSKGSLKAHEQTQLTVTHVGPKLQNSCYEQKLIRIISDKCETKVAVEIRHEKGSKDFICNTVYSNDYNVTFPATVINHKSIITIKVCNTSPLNVKLVLAECDQPFYIPSENFLLKKEWYCNFRVFFRPQTLGFHQGHATFHVFHDGAQVSTLKYELFAEAIGPK